MITIAIERRQSVVEETEIITTGSVGIEVKFNFNSDWDGLSRVAVFRVGDKEDWYDIMLDETNTCTIPWELLTVENEGEPVFVGAEGTLTDGTVVIPTVWVSVGAVKPGAHSGNASGADPTPTQWSQIRNLAEAAAVSASNAEDYAEDAHETAEAAQEIVSEFEGFTATATTLAAGSDATASYSDGVLSLGIPQGQKGEDGTSGEDGDDGVTFTPSVSSAGVISWTNDGGKPNPDPVDIMGPMGPPGVAVDDDAPTHGELVWIETDNSQTIILPEVDDTTASNNNTYSSNKIESIKSGIENTLNQFDQNMAYVESGNTASRTYATGMFISWKGTLYKTNAAIPQGTAFSSGSGGNLSTVVDSSGNLCGGLNDLRHSVKTLDLSTITPTSRLDIKSSLDNENIYTFPKTGYFMFSAKTSGLVQVGLAIASNGSSYLNVTVPAANSFVILVIKNMNAKISSANYANLNYAFFLPLDD